MGMLRILSKRGDECLLWKEQDDLAGDAEALAAIAEAERIFARQRAQGATAFRVEAGKPVVRWVVQCFDGIELLHMRIGSTFRTCVLGLQPLHHKILRLLGPASQQIYFLSS